MLDPIEVPRATIFPNSCVGCTGIDGPFLDLHRELAGYGRIYVCQRCVKVQARVFGIAKGKRMDELTQASKLLAQAQVEAEQQRQIQARLQDELSEARRANDGFADENVRLQGRVDQLETRFAEQAKAARELVGHA